MSKEKRMRKIRDKDNERPLKIECEFLDVFKVVKEDKERKDEKENQ